MRLHAAPHPSKCLAPHAPSLLKRSLCRCKVASATTKRPSAPLLVELAEGHGAAQAAHRLCQQLPRPHVEARVPRQPARLTRRHASPDLIPTLPRRPASDLATVKQEPIKGGRKWSNAASNRAAAAGAGASISGRTWREHQQRVKFRGRGASRDAAFWVTAPHGRQHARGRPVDGRLERRALARRHYALARLRDGLQLHGAPCAARRPQRVGTHAAAGRSGNTRGVQHATSPVFRKKSYARAG
jgi:hypothetical protein